jgi:ATP-binding cassette subfamily B protein
MTAELITATVILWHLHQPVLLLLFGAAIVAYGIVFAPSVIRMTERASAASLAAMDSSALMTDSILNYEVLKYFTAESMMHDRFGEALSHTESEWMRFFRYQAISGVLTSTVYAAFVAVTIVYATHLVNRFALSVGDWVLVIALISQIMRPVEVLSLAIRQLAQGIAFTETMMELITAEPEQQQSEAVFPHGCAGRLEFQHVRLAFSTRQLVLRDVSFNIPAGSTLAVVGDSGAGKSTLVKLLVRLIEPTGGQILLDGVPLSNISLPQLRQAVAIVPQEIMLLDTTIAENIALGRPGCSQRDVEDAAKVAALHDEIVRFPSGYHTRIGQRGIKLSGGEKQRIAIARAALKRPRIYVFDEATSSLDSKTEQVIVRNLRAVSQFTTTIIIAHRLSTVVGADEIIFLSAGSVVERGTHISLLRKNGQYSRFWHAQQRSV